MWGLSGMSIRKAAGIDLLCHYKLPKSYRLKPSLHWFFDCFSFYWKSYNLFKPDPLEGKMWIMAERSLSFDWFRIFSSDPDQKLPQWSVNLSAFHKIFVKQFVFHFRQRKSFYQRGNCVMDNALPCSADGLGLIPTIGVVSQYSDDFFLSPD